MIGTPQKVYPTNIFEFLKIFVEFPIAEEITKNRVRSKTPKLDHFGKISTKLQIFGIRLVSVNP